MRENKNWIATDNDYEEANKKKVAVKDLSSGVQEEVDENKVVEYFLSKEPKSLFGK